MAAFDMANPESVVSPGGVGFDINCGVRLLRTNLSYKDVQPVQVSGQGRPLRAPAAVRESVRCGGLLVTRTPIDWARKWYIHDIRLPPGGVAAVCGRITEPLAFFFHC